jgi:hypothetical protein
VDFIEKSELFGKTIYLNTGRARTSSKKETFYYDKAPIYAFDRKFSHNNFIGNFKYHSHGLISIIFYTWQLPWKQTSLKTAAT